MVWAVLILRVLVGSVLVAAGCGKVQSGSAAFVFWLLRLRVLRRGVLRGVALGLPAVELAMGAVLLAGAATAVVALAAAGTLAVFTLAVSATLARGRKAAHGSRSPEAGAKKEFQRTVVVRNLVLIAAASGVAGLAGRYGAGVVSVDAVAGSAAPVWGALIFAVAAAAVLTVSYCRLGHLSSRGTAGDAAPVNSPEADGHPS